MLFNKALNYKEKNKRYLLLEYIKILQNFVIVKSSLIGIFIWASDS